MLFYFAEELTMRRHLVARWIVATICVLSSGASISERVGASTPENTEVAAALTKEASEEVAQVAVLRRTADSIDDIRAIGTVFNEYMIDESTCYAIGRLFGRDAAVSHLKMDLSADLHTRTPENAYSLRVLAQGLENFADGTRYALGLSPKERNLKWNLDCAGKFGIDGRFADESGIHTFYTVSSDKTGIRVLGDIEGDFASRLIEAVEANPKVTDIVLGSGGGNVAQALKAGDFIRAHRLSTTLGDGCYSACPLVFVAGTKRSIWSPYPVLGFHEVSDGRTGVAEPLNSEVYKVIFQYLVRMGVDPRFVLSQMWSAAPTAMNTLSGNDTRLCDARVATWIQRMCSADDR